MNFSIKAVQPNSNSLYTDRYVTDTVTIKQVSIKRKKNFFIGLATGLFLVGTTGVASATIIDITPGSGSQATDYVTGLPEMINNTLAPDNNNDGVLYVWDEIQNFTLTEKLYIDRVADPNADYVGTDEMGSYITAGTVVSSHYVQWDPAAFITVQATLQFDADVFAVIHSDDKLFGSDYLGRPGINYGNFNMRGIEAGDTTNFNGGNLDIAWRAQSPGDWARVLTAYSPTVEEIPEPTPPASVPEPATIFLFGTGLAGLVGIRRRKKQQQL